MAFSLKKNEIILLFLCVIALAVLVGAQFTEENVSSSENTPPVEINIAGKKFLVEIADTEEKRTQGLSGREFLKGNEGMIFVFPESDYYGFWMKDMRFPIDIIWLDENFSVIGITEHVSPETFPNVFYPPEPVRFVLEVSAGTTKNLLEIGKI